MIDDPFAPMRSQMSDEKLDELVASIRSHGLIQPITLRPVCRVNGSDELVVHPKGYCTVSSHDTRYEVVAGHRRFKACKRADMATIPSIVHGYSDEEVDGVRMHENLYREDVNPVDEARYIRLMIDKHGMKPSDLAKATGKSQTYLQARYDLLDYPDYLVAEVEAEHISLSAAHWLVKIEDEIVRKEYCRFAMLGGITAKRAEAWYRSWLLGNLPRDSALYVPSPGLPNVAPLILEMPCVLCAHKDDIQKMSMQYAHLECVRAVEDMNKRNAPVATATA